MQTQHRFQIEIFYVIPVRHQKCFVPDPIGNNRQPAKRTAWRLLVEYANLALGKRITPGLLPAYKISTMIFRGKNSYIIDARPIKKFNGVIDDWLFLHGYQRFRNFVS